MGDYQVQAAMKALFIKAPYRDVYGPLKLAAGNYFLLGLGYIAAFLRENGYAVAIVDPEAQGLDDSLLIKRIKTENPELIGISATTPDFANALKIAGLIRKNSNAFILLGGIHASSLPEYIYQRYPEKFDAVCIGEGEITTLEICRYLEGKIKSLSDIKGICFRNGERIVRTQPRPFIQDVDNLPFPARELVDLSLYRPNSFNFRKGKTATIITSRGCPFRCTFCASKLTLGGKFRARSADNVLKEIKHLAEEYEVNHILIQDDTFTFDVNRAKEICRKLIDSKLGIEWFAFSQVSQIDEELISLMKEAGCYSVGFGIESADREVLKNMRKAVTVEQCEFAVRTAQKYNLKTQGYFIFGNKGDTKKTAGKTIKFACALSPTFAFFNKLIPYPGTEIFEEYFKDGYKDIDWSNFVPYGVKAACSTQNFSKRELQLLAFKANLLFYFRPSQIFRILKTIKSFAEFKQYLKGAIGLMLQIVSWRKT
jgi:radical SAM superfamily enzyme YgiQ (UPF0313 family)